MRSRPDYIVTKDEVHGYANHWLASALKLEYEGRKCNASTLLQVLLLAASRVASIFAVCRDLSDAPCDQTIRNALGDPALRLLFVGVALVLRNVWVWLHFKLAKGKWDDEPQLLLELLRFREMLLWIGQVVGRMLGADQNQGIDRGTYDRLAGNA